jgi:endonuclease YncB( thermonuclease family)
MLRPCQKVFYRISCRSFEDTVMKQFEQEAKESKKGLWADQNPTPPWLYRRLDAGAYP